jgi:hypothetical protein
MAAPTQGHNTNAAFHRVPVELWLFVFECFVHSDRDVHMFDQTYQHRRTAIRRLQDLQRVCRLWAVSTLVYASFQPCSSSHVLQYLLRPFVHRHSALQGLLPTTLNPPTLISFGRYSNLVRVSEHLYCSEAGAGSWTHTLSVHTTPEESRANEFTLSIRCLAPCLTRLTHFASHAVLSPESFDVLTSTTHSTLKVLHVALDERASAALLFLDRLSNLTDLSLNMSTSLKLPSTSHVPSLPKLTRLDLSGHNSGIFFAAFWFKGMQESSMHTLRLTIDGFMCCALLVPFFARHRHILKTLILRGGLFRDLRYPLARATALETIELWSDEEVVEEMLEFDLPKSKILVEEDRERGCTVLRFDGRSA